MGLSSSESHAAELSTVSQADVLASICAHLGATGIFTDASALSGWSMNNPINNIPISLIADSW
ncbi:MAG: hypothetical protein KKD28_03235 [Chloroflexi bacterium]|nr:hypothetical protein [Chloroflexota bacterium]